jgi:hypothetical protein
MHVIKDRPLPPLKSGMRHIIAKSGVYVERANDLFHSCVKGNVELPFMEHEEFAKLKCGKLPAELMTQAIGFFEAVEDEYRSEGALVILYNLNTKKFSLYCPDQDVSWGAVKFSYPTELSLPDVIVFGDIHSHPGSSPAPSYTDLDDQMDRDGVHLIVGYVRDRAYAHRPATPIEISAGFAVDGGRVEMRVDEVVEPGWHDNGPAPPKEWMKKVTQKKTQHHYGHHGYDGYGYPPYSGSQVGCGGYSPHQYDNYWDEPEWKQDKDGVWKRVHPDNKPQITEKKYIIGDDLYGE